jgi:hypothetical protein
VAGVIGATVVVVLGSLTSWGERFEFPAYLAVERAIQISGGGGVGSTVTGVVASLALGAAWGGLFGLMIPRLSPLTGFAFGLVPALANWLLAGGLGAPRSQASFGLLVWSVAFHAVLWGTLVGWLCRRWLRPPYAAATSPLRG